MGKTVRWFKFFQKATVGCHGPIIMRETLKSGRKTCHLRAWRARTQPVCPQPRPHALTTGPHMRAQCMRHGLSISPNVRAGRDLRLFNPHESQAGKQRSPKGALPRSHRSSCDLKEPGNCLALEGGASRTPYPALHQLWTQSSVH